MVKYVGKSKNIMGRPLGILFAVFAVAMTFALLVSGSDESTLKGTGMCAKCSLKETDTCQTVIQIKREKGITNYYLVQNVVSKDFHGAICKESKIVKAKGIIKDVNGKMEFTASQIKLVKDN